MRNVFRTYEIQLEVMEPLYIGCGQKVGKKEYVFLSKEKRVVVLNQQKLFHLLERKKLLSDYQKFMLGASKWDVGRWLESKRITSNEYLTCGQYEIDAGDAVEELRSKPGIEPFIKDVYGKPYIPGSSLKGMLRTILLAQNIMETENLYDDTRKTLKRTVPPDRYVYQRDAKSMEMKFYHNLQRVPKKQNAVNDFMSGVVIGDSEPLEVNDLILCRRLKMYTDGKEKSLNVIRECIRPGTKVKFMLTIDTSKCHLDKKALQQAISDFSEMYYQCFLKKFRFPRQEENSVWLGGGVGFVSKTEIYPLLGESQGVDATIKVFKETKVPWKHKHVQDKQLGVSPHICKIARYQGKLYQVGLCRIQIEEKNFSPEP